MRLTVLASGSTGNGYLLHNSKETLIIEAGVRLSIVKKALGFDLSGIAGCLVSHGHGDHSKHVKDYMNAGIMILSHEDLFLAKDIPTKDTRIKVMYAGRGYKIGNFRVIPFELEHDVKCFGYLIDHPETGKIVFITDSYLCEYRFPGVNQIILEANYCDDILERNIVSGSVHPSMRPRLLKSHMELQTTIGILRANDLTHVNNIVLCHLSSGNSDEARFIREVKEATGKMVYAASPRLSIDFNINIY